MRPIKIGIAGTHSTGKSSFLESLEPAFQQAGYRVRKIDDLALEARDRGFPILQNHTFNSTLWIMTRGIALELEASLDADIILVDRPVPDAIGYLLAALMTRREQLPEWQSTYLFDLARHHAQTYTLLFKTVIDPQVPIGTNKPRDRDPEFRRLAAQGVDTVFNQLKLSFEPLNKATTQQVTEQTINTVLAYLQT
jgi:hypothetical protein